MYKFSSLVLGTMLLGELASAAPVPGRLACYTRAEARSPYVVVLETSETKHYAILSATADVNTAIIFRKYEAVCKSIGSDLVWPIDVKFEAKLTPEGKASIEKLIRMRKD